MPRSCPWGRRTWYWRAARQFQEETGQKQGMLLSLRKRIPVAAGLGGGSSDAAGTLLALNDLAGKPLTPARLHHLASRLGADVPFFLNREPGGGAGHRHPTQPGGLTALLVCAA